MCECKADLHDKIILSLKKLGILQQKLTDLLDEEIFDNLHKHNPYFISNNEIEYEKLSHLRMNLVYLEDKITECFAILVDE